MSLLWPGDDRAGHLCSDEAFLEALVAVESAWTASLVEVGVAPASAQASLEGRVDQALVAHGAEAGGNPVVAMVAVLRDRLDAGGEADAARWLHRGLTSQDVVDTALVLCARAAVDATRGHLARQVRALVPLVEQHRGTRTVARTLTQPALPSTFAAKAATWLDGLLDAADVLDVLVFPVQLGGAAGTLAGIVELAGVDGAQELRRALPRRLALAPSRPWHTRRTAVTRIGDAAVTTCDALGHVANDVLVLGRPEVGELALGSVGGSSSMPHKRNPTAAVLVRRAAIAAPALGSALHAGAAEQVDERADGGWHVEWETLALLLRRTVVAASQLADLLDGLHVEVEAMAARSEALDDVLRSEQRELAGLAGRDPRAAYDGLLAELVDESLQRAGQWLAAPGPQEERWS